MATGLINLTIRKEDRAYLNQTVHLMTAAANKSESQAIPVLPELCNYIDGGTSVPAVDRTNSLRNPNNQQEIQGQLSCSNDQVEMALTAADAAFHAGEWEQTPVEERAAALESIADQLEQPATREQLAFVDAITTGAVIKATRQMARLAPFVFRATAEYLRNTGLSWRLPGKIGEVEYFRRPLGPALLVSPWNGPTAIGSHKIASALGAGAPCIVKPSEWAPHSALIMARIIHDMGLPRGTFQLTCGNRDIGGRMVADSRIKSVSFTGGLAGGRAIAAACAGDFKPTQLELGGNNPLVVFEDADLELAARGIVYGLTNLNAQWCRALGRVVVHRSVKSDLLELVEAKLADLVLGDSLSDSSDMGPMIHQAQYDSVLSSIETLTKRGGSLISPTSLPTSPDLSGYFIAPTLIDGCEPQDTQDEIFGPAAAIHSFDTEAEALALANGTPFGLAAYVYSQNEEKAFAFGRQLRTGGVKINGYSLLSLSGAAPRGAWGLSGLGEEGTGESVTFFTGARVVGVSPQDTIGGV